MNTGSNVSTFTSELENADKLSQDIEALFTNELEVDEIEFSDEDIKNLDDLRIMPGACTLCRKVMNKLFQQIPKGSSKDSVKKALDQICSLFHNNKLKTRCRNFVAAKGDQIAESVLTGVPSALVCKVIRIC